HGAFAGGEHVKSPDPPADFGKRPWLWHVAQRGARANRGSIRISFLAARDESGHPLRLLSANHQPFQERMDPIGSLYFTSDSGQVITGRPCLPPRPARPAR